MLWEGGKDTEKKVEAGAAIHRTAVAEPPKGTRALSKVGEFPLVGDFPPSHNVVSVSEPLSLCFHSHLCKC